MISRCLGEVRRFWFPMFVDCRFIWEFIELIKSVAARSGDDQSSIKHPLAWRWGVQLLACLLASLSCCVLRSVGKISGLGCFTEADQRIYVGDTQESPLKKMLTNKLLFSWFWLTRQTYNKKMHLQKTLVGPPQNIVMKKCKWKCTCEVIFN